MQKEMRAHFFFWHFVCLQYIVKGVLLNVLVKFAKCIKDVPLFVPQINGALVCQVSGGVKKRQSLSFRNLASIPTVWIKTIKMMLTLTKKN